MSHRRYYRLSRDSCGASSPYPVAVFEGDIIGVRLHDEGNCQAARIVSTEAAGLDASLLAPEDAEDPVVPIAFATATNCSTCPCRGAARYQKVLWVNLTTTERTYTVRR